MKTKPLPGWTQTSLLALALFLLNFYICHELFRIEYLRHMGSIEGAFIGISRYVTAHWNDLKWFPLWNDGIPFPTTYPPLLHFIVALAASLRGASIPQTYHWITALAYCLGPVALFALAFRLSGSRWAGFVAGLLYSSVSMSFWLIPAVRTDLGSPFFSRRLQALVYYGEGPHVSSMTLLVLALLCLDVAMVRRRAPGVLLAAVAIAATALTNWLGAFAIVLTVLPYSLAHFPGRWTWRDLARLALIAAAAYGLAMPLMPPSTIAVLQANASTTGGDYTHAYRAAWVQGAAIIIMLGAIKAAVRRWAPHLQFAVLFAFLMTLIPLADAWWNVTLVPMAVRYDLEMEMALAMLVAFVAHALLRGRARWVAVVSLAVLLLGLIQPIRLDRRYAGDVLLRPVDIQKTVEWKTAQWLNQHWTGQRVMLPGSTSFWLTAFSDTPEIWGFDQGTTDPLIRTAEYAIYNRADAETSVLWLKALGVQAVGVSGPASTEEYKPFSNPKKFEGVLEPLWRDGDDVLYRLGRAEASLARVVPRTSLVSAAPANGFDVNPLRPYVAALEDPRMPYAEFRWTSMHSAGVTTDLEAGQVVSVQMAWHQGWHATVNGRQKPVQRDAIGLMYVAPDISGHCDIEMVYDGGIEMRLAHWISSLTLAGLLLWSVLGALRRTA